MNQTDNETPSSARSQASESPAPRLNDDQLTELVKVEQKSGNRLAIFVFLATFLGTLLGVVADLSGASAMVAPILETFSPSPELHIVGSDTILGDNLGMAAEWRDKFQAQEQWQVPIPLIGPIARTVKVTIAGIGTLKGVESAATGQAVNILAASEPLTPERTQQLAGAGITIQCAAEIGYDVIAFITDFNNRTPHMSSQDMSKIITGEIDDWSIVGGDPQKIRVLARPGSGTTEVILSNFTGSPEWRSHFIPCGESGGNQACLDLTLRIPGSLYWVSSAWMQTQPTRYLAVVSTRIAPNAPETPNPLEEEFDPDQYPRELIRPLYMYILSGKTMDAESTEYAKKFLRYVRSVHGQEILEDHHFYTFFDPPGNPGEIKIDLPAPFNQPDANGLRPDCLE
jgi:ABC-type phosphate transport system substrate-binding protein